MSFPEIEDLTEAELKAKLSKMGMSFDRIKHPKDYYIQLYLDRSNTKSRITRGNTPFYKKKIINRKRLRTNNKDKEEISQEEHYKENINQNYEEKNSEEEEIRDASADLLQREEQNELKNKNFNFIERTKIKEKKDNINNDYRESGIKITNLIRIKKPKPKNIKSTEKKGKRIENLQQKVFKK